MRTKLLTTFISSLLVAGTLQNSWADQPAANCATAQDDISQLQREKEKTAKGKSKGILSYTPIGLLAGAITAKPETPQQMHVDEYNKKIDAKIAQIKNDCNIKDPSDSSW